MTNNPVISDHEFSLQQAVTTRIHEVATDIHKQTLSNERVDVYGGKPGVALTFAWLGNFFPDKQYMDIAFELLDQLIDDLGNTEWSPDRGAELAGAAFVLQHLQNNGIIDENDDLGLEAVDEFLLTSAPYFAGNRNWDPLLGITPMGIYFLERYRKTGNPQPLEIITGLLIGLSSKYEGYDVWITPGHYYQPNDCLNFGMAHGMPGLISFLSKVYATGIKTGELEPMVNSCIQFLLSKQNPADSVSQFPSYIFPELNEDESKLSRLGWCYGDLGMSFALIHWGMATAQPELIKQGTAFALNTTSRSMESIACTDAPLCHGSAGLVHQYNRLYGYTNEPAFKAAAQVWIKNTLEHYYLPGKGVGGYPFMTYDEEKKATFPKSNASLLEGAAGVALALASALFDEPPAWDALFLTNLK